MAKFAIIHGGSASTMLKSAHLRGFANITCMIVSTLLRIALLATLLTSGAATALGLGEIKLHSRMGEALRAVLPIHTAGESLGVECISLAPLPGADFPVVMGATLRLIHLGQDYRLIITGKQPLTEPIAVANIRIACGFELQREYVLLPAPPPVMDSADSGEALPTPPLARRKARQTADTSARADLDAPRKLPAQRSESTEHGTARKAAATSPLARLKTGRDRLILGSEPEDPAPTFAKAQRNEMDERMLKMDTTLHLLNAEVEKLGSALALGAESRATRLRLQALQAQPSIGLPKPPPAERPVRRNQTLDGWIELLVGILIGGAVSATVAHLASRPRSHTKPFAGVVTKIAKPRQADA